MFRQGRKRHRPVADRRAQLAGRGEQLRLLRPAATMQGATTEPGLERVDIKKDGSGCRTVWRSREIAPSVVPKLSLETGLVYTYTKPRARRTGRSVVPHGAQLLHRPHRVPPARGSRPRLQQQLRAGDPGRRRRRLRGRARRAGAVRRRHAAGGPARFGAQGAARSGRGCACWRAAPGGAAAWWRGSAGRTAGWSGGRRSGRGSGAAGAIAAARSGACCAPRAASSPCARSRACATGRRPG